MTDKEKPQILDYTLKMRADWILKPKQNEIVDFLIKHPFAFNCAQTGIGKTITSLTAAIHTYVNRKDDDIHFVLLLPGSAVKAFTDALGKVLGIPYNIYTATTLNVMPDARFHIFNYSTIGSGVFDKKNKKGDSISLQEAISRNQYITRLMTLYKTHKNLWLIADEAHALQDINTVQYRVVDGLRAMFIGMWLLTATPILNNLDGLFHMTDILMPGFFGNIYRFRNKYCVLETNIIYKYDRRKHARIPIKTTDVIGYKNLDHLSSEFEKISIIRADEYDIRFNYRSAHLSEYMIKFYELAIKGLFSGKHINTKIGKNGLPKKVTKKSKQEHAGARLHDMQRVVSNSHKDFQALNKDEITEKEYLLIQTILEVINRNEAVLIYFSYLETLARVKYILNIIKNKFDIKTIHEISGSIKLHERKIVESALKPRDIVLMTSAGTESVNLQKANNLIFYEIPFALRQFIQACGRIARTNSEYEIFNIYILEAVGTIDTYKKNRILMNSGPIKAVLGGSNILPVETLTINLADKAAMKDKFLWNPKL